MSEPKYKVGDEITNGKGIFTIVTLCSDKYLVEDSFGRYGFLHFKNQDKWKILEEEDLDLKFKAGDRVFNKITRKWVNIIEFDIETGLYIVRYDDGIQGRSLESELCENGGIENMKNRLENSIVLGPLPMPSDKEIQETWDEHLRLMEEKEKEKNKPKFKVGDIIVKAHLRFRIIKVESDRYIVEERPGINLMVLFEDQDKYRLVKEEGITTIDKAAEVFAEMLELIGTEHGFSGAKEWENEFRKRLEE